MIAQLDIAELEIPVGVPVNPDLVDLYAANCQWISLRQMEKKCEIGDTFVIRKVIHL